MYCSNGFSFHYLANLAFKGSKPRVASVMRQQGWIRCKRPWWLTQPANKVISGGAPAAQLVHCLHRGCLILQADGRSCPLVLQLSSVVSWFISHLKFLKPINISSKMRDSFYDYTTVFGYVCMVLMELCNTTA